jgi:hypothetical protein
VPPHLVPSASSSRLSPALLDFLAEWFAGVDWERPPGPGARRAAGRPQEARVARIAWRRNRPSEGDPG